MRLPYIDPEVQGAVSSEKDAAIVARIRQRRAPRPLKPLDLTLLHSPDVADGWNSFLGAIRTNTSLADDIREIAICRVAVINKAWYEWGHHAPLAEAAGISEEGMKTLKLAQLPEKEVECAMSEEQLAVARYTDAMTSNVSVPQKLFDGLKGHFSEQAIVELTATVSVSHLQQSGVRRLLNECLSGSRHTTV